MTINHENFRALVPGHLAGHLEDGQRDAFRLHRDTCPDCAAFLAEESALWETLSAADPDSLGGGASVWPEVRGRTFGRGRESAWFFGNGRMARVGLASCAVTAGLAIGLLAPPDTGTDGVTALTGDSYMSDSNWFDDSSDQDLAGLWLQMVDEEVEDGS